MKEALVVNWDSYPNNTSGGVYTWEKSLIEGLSDWRFSIINFLSNPNTNRRYLLPPNVSNVIELPIFGSNRYEEFYNDTTSLFAKIARTNESVIKKQFIPMFRNFLNNAIMEDCDPKEFGLQVHKLHSFLTRYDSKKCLEYVRTWETFYELLDSDNIYRHMPLKSALTAFQMIQRNIQLFSIDIPKVDLIHCSLAWFPSLVGVFGKIENNCPMILTEHGVAFRELLLYYNAYLTDEPSHVFAKVLSRNIVRAIYSAADIIAPVCHANAVWEKMLGVDEQKIRVIHNGVDVSRFKPMQVERPSKGLTVVFVGRVDIFKDVICILQAISKAKDSVPGISCLIYGASTDLDYSLRCVKALNDLKLEDDVRFMGKISEPERAYNYGDVIVSSSITEGFPFSVIEAMSCGKPVIATDVGGVREALSGCGILVKSRRPTELANAIVTLAKDQHLRNELGTAGMKRVREKFTLQKCMERYRNLYEEVTSRPMFSEEQEEPVLNEAIVR